jgi:hypothetical protein
MINQEEITRSTEELKKFYTSSMTRLPAIMKLIKLMQDGLHKPMLDHNHKMFYGQISENLESQETNIMLQIDFRTNQEIALQAFHTLLKLDYQLRERRIESMKLWESSDKPEAAEMIIKLYNLI